MKAFETGPFTGGANSLVEGTLLTDRQYAWGVNVLNRGGVVQTRPGFVANPVNVVAGTLANVPNNCTARALTIFTPQNGIPVMVVAVTSPNGVQYLYRQEYPFSGAWDIIPNVAPIPPSATKVVFETAVIGVTQDQYGNLTQIDPYPALIITNDAGPVTWWDGVTGGTLSMSGLWTKWIGNRLWISNGARLRASNLLNPLLFTEEDILSEGGYFVLPDTCTGLGTTPDYKSLLAFTKDTTSSFQASNTDRTSWQKTAGFQQLLFSNIGCVGGKGIINQYGMTWWMSQGGLIGLDNALQTYRSSRIHYRDSNMVRSKANISSDGASDICLGKFENFLAVSVPSGDLYNAHTWVMDQSVMESSEQDSPIAWASVWTGIRPVQWITAFIKGRTRCFALSNDIPPTGAGKVRIPCVWEMFTDSYRDIGYNSSTQPVAKDISCSLETKYMGNPMGYMLFDYAEIEVDELYGPASIQVYYSGRRSGYKKILDTFLNSTVFNLRNYNLANYSSLAALTTMPAYVPQRRLVKTQQETQLSSDSSPVEKPFTNKRDKFFSLYITWTGKLGISKARIFATEDTDQTTGKCNDDELTERYVDANGTSQLLNWSIVAPLSTSNYHTKFVTSQNQRMPEITYQSNV